MTLKIGIIREGKTPPDSRVPITPKQAKYIQENYPVNIKVQSSKGRCFPDEDYKAEGIEVVESVADCEVLMGVKEVPVEQLIPSKKYFFFSHTIKEQPYNRDLLRAIVDKEIQLIDYEVLTDEKGKRVIAFGKFAGMVGAHNGMMTYGWRTGAFDLPRMNSFLEYKDAIQNYKTQSFPPIKIIVTGGGRVAQGAMLVLDDMDIKKVSPSDYLTQAYDYPVYTQLNCEDYVEHSQGKPFDKADYYKNPRDYKSKFAPYAEQTDLFINGIYWDNEAPQFFSQEEMKNDDFNIKVIADVTCDIAPVASIPSTLFATTIADPIFGYNPLTGKADEPHQEHIIDMMTIDNLPNELPRDASKAFGEQFINEVLSHLIQDSQRIENASVTKDGQLGPNFGYLKNYLEGK